MSFSNTTSIHAPKGKGTSYMFYTNAVRASLKSSNPDLTFGELAKKMGEDWKALTVSEKEPYEEKARVDKERFDKEMSRYTPPPASSSDSDSSSSDSDSDSDSDGSGTKKKKKKKKQKKQKSPVSLPPTLSQAPFFAPPFYPPPLLFSNVR